MNDENKPNLKDKPRAQNSKADKDTDLIPEIDLIYDAAREERDLYDFFFEGRKENGDVI